MKMRFQLTIVTLSISLVPSVLAGVLPYDFTITPAVSGITAGLSIQANTAGTLIGDFDPDANPAGTRTKPGLFGAFGETENLPVDVTLGFGLGGGLDSQTTGGFQLALDPQNGLLRMSGYHADMLSSGPATLPATITLETQTFRTRNPSSVYVGGFPITVPVGEATLSTMTAEQIGAETIGTLTETRPGEYDFTLPLLVSLTADAELFGNPSTLPGVPLAMLLQGQITLAGDTATLHALQPILFENTTDVNQALPQFPLDLPTILPPGDTAHLLFDLMLSDIVSSIDGESKLGATGVIVPEPTVLGVLLLAFPLLRRRR